MRASTLIAQLHLHRASTERKAMMDCWFAKLRSEASSEKLSIDMIGTCLQLAEDAKTRTKDHMLSAMQLLDVYGSLQNLSRSSTTDIMSHTTLTWDTANHFLSYLHSKGHKSTRQRFD